MGQVKGRGCADGRPQRQWTKKEDATSPTVSTESVMITSVIDAAEDREVAVVHIPGAFIQTNMDDEVVHVRINGKMTELLVEINPEKYKEFVVYERGEAVIYCELLKALYGTLRAARMSTLR